MITVQDAYEYAILHCKDKKEPREIMLCSWEVLGMRKNRDGTLQDSFARVARAIMSGVRFEPGDIFTCPDCQKRFIEIVMKMKDQPEIAHASA